MSVGRSGSPRRELEPLPLDPLDPLDACDSAESAGSDCEPPMDISGEKVRQEATDSNEKVDSSYVLARQTDHRILTAFNKLTSFTIYGPNHPKKAKRLSGWAGVRARVKALMSSHASHMFWAMVIMTNSVYLGVHLDWSVDHRGSSGNPTFFALHLVYALLFTLEVGLRIIAWGCRALLWGQDWVGTSETMASTPKNHDCVTQSGFLMPQARDVEHVSMRCCCDITSPADHRVCLAGCGKCLCRMYPLHMPRNYRLKVNQLTTQCSSSAACARVSKYPFRI